MRDGPEPMRQSYRSIRCVEAQLPMQVNLMASAVADEGRNELADV
jgi:hypothetical protein